MVLKESLRALSDGLNRGVTAISALLVLAMFVISLVGIFHKFFLGSPLAWAFSINRLLLPWLAMLSLTVALKAGEHVAMTVLLNRLPTAVMRALQAVNFIVVALVGIALAWFGYGFFLGSNQLFMVSDVLQVSGRWSAAAIPICGLIICVHLASGFALVGHREPGGDELG